MFSIVSMQDVLLNLRGGDGLFQMFDRPRTRKKSTSLKNAIVAQETFPIKKVWVLPSHLITMITTGNKEEIISYDQVPKLGSNKNDRMILLENKTSAVFDIFQTVHIQEYVFILLKTGRVIIWNFQKPEYEWRKLKEHTLCKSKDSQIISYVYDDKLQLLVWCERRSATQFCICRVHLKFSSGGVVLFEEVKAILHNCLPMNIYSLSKGYFSFVPVSNKTLGLFLFWSNLDEKITVSFSLKKVSKLKFELMCIFTTLNLLIKLERQCQFKSILENQRFYNIISYTSSFLDKILDYLISVIKEAFDSKESATFVLQVRMWGEEFNEHCYTATTADYQTIVRDCLYLWINRTSFENKIISQTSHPNSQDLFVLQNDLNVYVVYLSPLTNSIESRLLCTLEETPEGGEAFSKQITKFYPIQRMLLLLMADGTVNIFENQGGLFLWKTQTFRSGAPQIWIREGNYPTAGVWNRSGIWNLRPKPIADQLKEILVKQNLILGEEKKDQDSKFLQDDNVSDPEFALGVFEEQKKLKRPKARKLRIKQGVNRSEDIPISSIFSILSLWQLGNVSAETAISLAIKLKEMKETDEEMDLSEVFCLINVIKDPVLLLVLFANKTFPFCVKKELTYRLQSLLGSASVKNLDPDVLSLLKQYLSAEDKIKGFFTEEDVQPVKTVSGNIIEKEFLRIETFVCGANYHLSWLDRLLGSIMSMNTEEFMKHILHVMLGSELCKGTAFAVNDEFTCQKKSQIEIWKVFLSSDSAIFTKLCSYLWKTEPTLLQNLIEKAQYFAEENSGEMFPIVFKLEATISKLWNILYLPGVDEPNHNVKMKIYAELARMSPSCDNVYDIFLEHQMIDEAFEMLTQHNQNDVQHASMFYQMVTYLLNNKLLGQYADKLSSFAPTNFKMAEFCNMYKVQAVELGRGSVFRRSQRDLTIGELKLFLETLM